MQNGVATQIRNTALGYLARREYSLMELRNKLLAKKNWPMEQINLVLEQLTEDNLLSDRRYAEMYIRSRSSKGFGPDRIALELQQKGINSGLVQEILEQSEVDWLQVIRAVWQKKFRLKSETAGQLSYQDRAKQSQFLRYRGFDQEQIVSLFDRETVDM